MENNNNKVILDRDFIPGNYSYEEVSVLNAATEKNFVTGFILEQGIVPVAIIGVPLSYKDGEKAIKINYNGSEKDFFFNGSNANVILNTEFKVLSYEKDIDDDQVMQQLLFLINRRRKNNENEKKNLLIKKNG